MLERVDIETFVEAPFGRYTSGQGAALFCISNRCYGAVLHGVLGLADHALIQRGVDAERLLDRPYDTIQDLRTFRGIKPKLSAKWIGDAATYAAERRGALRRQVTLVPAGSIVETMARGFTKLVPLPWTQLFANTAEEALQLLHHAQASPLGEAIDALRLNRENAESLTKREREIARLATQGFSDLNIAITLGVRESTVGTHLLRIYRKLGVQSRAQLASKTFV